MVKKLLKQEFTYYLRSLTPVYIILLGISILGRITHFFESDNWIYEIVGNASVAVYAVSVLATLGFATAFIIIRFYKNMFTGEGYLTLTLPVSYEQHLMTKLIAAMLVSFTSLITVLISCAVFLGSEWMVEIYKAAAYLVQHAIEKVGGNFGLYVVEFLILLIVGTAAEILNYYMCISLGQTFKKRRILAAIGIYYGLSLVVQIGTIIFSTMINLAWENIDIDVIEKWLSANYIGLIHGVMITGIIMSILLACMMFLISRFVLKKKLNLE